MWKRGARWIGATSPFDAVVRAAIDSYVSIFDTFTIADLTGDPLSGRMGCLDCDLHTLIRRGGSLGRVHRLPVFGKLAVHTA